MAGGRSPHAVREAGEALVDLALPLIIADILDEGLGPLFDADQEEVTVW